MKKFTFILLICCMAFAANAQKTKNAGGNEKQSNVSHEVINLKDNYKMHFTSQKLTGKDFINSTKEGTATIVFIVEDVWEDGTGYQMLLDADATAYGNQIPVIGQFDTGDLPASLYEIFEYKIPANADGAVNTSNVILDDSVSISVPAGFYDYVITNPSPDEDADYNRVWIAASDCYPSRADNFEFLAGYVYTFSVTYNEDTYSDCVSQVVTIEEGNTDHLIFVDNVYRNLIFPVVFGETSGIAEIEVRSFNLTSGIVATTVSPFLISTDNQNFATTAALASEGGVLYVKFDPSQVGDATGIITFTSAGADDVTVTLNGIAQDCSPLATLPINQGFEDYSALCWSGVEASASSNNVLGISFDYANSGNYSWQFSSYEENDDNIYDQYLISCEIGVTHPIFFSFYYLAVTETNEKFRIGYSQTTNELSSFQWSDEIVSGNTENWESYGERINSAKYVAIHYYSEYSYDLFIDDISITASVDVPVSNLNKVSIYPNPSNGNVNILVSENSTVKLMDVTGRTIETYNVNANSTLNISQASGAYFVQVESNGNIETHKLIIR